MFCTLFAFNCDKCLNHFRFIAETTLTAEQYKTMTIEQAENYVSDNLNNIFSTHKRCDECYEKYCIDCVNFEKCAHCDLYICDPCNKLNLHICVDQNNKNKQENTNEGEEKKVWISN
jgi:hypothetical protein